MTTRRIVVASLPEHADKRGLLPPADRGVAAFRSFNTGRTADVGCSEFSKHARAEAERRHGWTVTDTKPNNDFGGGDRRGNVILVKRKHGALIDESELTVDWDRHHPRGLTAAIALIEDEAGLLLRVHAHAPRPGGPHGDPDMNRAVLSAVIGYCDDAHAKGYPVGLTIDTNNGEVAIRGVTMAGGTVLARSGVDLICGWGLEAAGEQSAQRVAWSDHYRLSIATKRKPVTERLSRRCPNP